MTEILFAIALALGLTLNLLLLRTLYFPPFRLWPAPEAGSWQSMTFWTCFRGGMLGAFLLGLADWNAVPLFDETRFLVGLPLIVIGFGVTILSYFNLGLGNTYCGSDGLVTGGIYRISRNPQYTFSIMGLLGVAVLANSYLTIVQCAVMASGYVLMAFAEEAWLARLYGETYRDYCRKTARFLDIPALFGLKDKQRAGSAG